MKIHCLSILLDDISYPIMFSFHKNKLEEFIQLVRQHDSDYWLLSEDDELAKDKANDTHPLKHISDLFGDVLYGYVHHGYTYADSLTIDSYPLDEVILL